MLRRFIRFLKHTHFRSTRYRALLAGLIAVAVLIVSAFAILLYGRGLISRGPIEVYAAPDGTEHDAGLLNGWGMNLVDLEQTNLLSAPDFAPDTIKLNLALAELHGNEFYVPYEAGLHAADRTSEFTDGFFDHCKVELHREDPEQLAMLGTAAVQSFKVPVAGKARVLESADKSFHDLSRPLGDIAWRSDRDGNLLDAVAVGNGGLILTGLQKNRIEVPDYFPEAYRRNDLIAIAATAEAYYCIDSSGRIFRSADAGRNWDVFVLPNKPADWKAYAVCANGGELYFGGPEGRLLHVSGKDMRWLTVKDAGDFISLAVSGDELLLLDRAGTLYEASREEGVHEESGAEEKSDQDQNSAEHSDLQPQKPQSGSDGWNWQKFSSLPKFRTLMYSRGFFYAQTQDSILYRGEKGSDLERAEDLPPQDPAKPCANTTDQTFRRILPLSRSSHICQQPDGKLLIQRSAGGPYEALQVELPRLRSAFLCGADRLLVQSRDNRIMLVPLFASFELTSEKSIPDLRPGDKLIAQIPAWRIREGVINQFSPLTQKQQITATELNASTKRLGNAWELSQPEGCKLIYDSQKQQSILELAPGSGVSQRLPIRAFVPNRPYRFSIQREVETDGVPAGDSSPEGGLELHLTGPFNELIFLHERFAGNGQDKRVDFLMPNFSSSPAAFVTLHLQNKGKKPLRIRSMSLSDMRRSEQSMTREISERAAPSRPAFIRIPELGIGSVHLPADAWQCSPDRNLYYYNARGVARHTIGLEAALQICRQTNSDPWICIESFATAEDMGELMEYLAAPASETLGKLRTENGSAVPWTSIFSRLIFEFKDDESIHKTALDKSLYAGMLRKAIEKSPYYDRNKNKIFFVDGMGYEGQEMRSGADFHASDLPPSPEILLEHLNGEAKQANAEVSPEAFDEALYLAMERMNPRVLDHPYANTGNLVRSYRYIGPESLTTTAQTMQNNTESVTAQQILLQSLRECGTSVRVLMYDVDFSQGEAADRPSEAAMSILRMLSQENGMFCNDRKISDERAIFHFVNASGRQSTVMSNRSKKSLSFELNGADPKAENRMEVYDAALSSRLKRPYPGNGKRIDLLPGETIRIDFPASYDSR